MLFECIEGELFPTAINGVFIWDARATSPTVPSSEVCVEFEPDAGFPTLDNEGAAEITSAILLVFALAFTFRLILKQMKVT